ncbi:MAG: glucans biosynthesis glucosyltransferase MdoH [Acetobacteraceae bacterium]
MPLRVLTVILIVFIVFLCLATAMFLTLAPGGWTVAKAVMMLSCLGAAPWVGFCAANGLIGFVLRLSRPVVLPSVGIDGALPLTAIALTVRNEDMALVLPSAGRLLERLDALGVGHAFTLFVLSDTNDPAAVFAEERAMASFRTNDRFPDRIHYRRRPDNSGFKAGNVMDFLERLADGFELMLILDADSDMTPAAVLRLVTAMRDNPSLGIIQHLTVGLPASSAFPRLFQFGMRAGMRTWATALSWWQGDASVYWGHNAVVRITPFREHCRLPLLPNGSHILSHDQVEAAMLRGAGWGIRLLAEEDGSYEANPPALPEFMRRELRWLAGNFEYRHLLRMPGLRPMGRWQLMQAILLFATPPFYLAFLLAAAWAAATDTTSPFPFGPALAATLIWAGALYAPKLTGYLEVLFSREKRMLYGRPVRILIGITLETVFTLLLDAINVVAKTIAMVRIALGLRAAWTPQNRSDRGISWTEAAHLLWPQTIIGLVVFACFVRSGWTAVAWAAPFAIGLVLAIPFCVITADPAVGTWLRERRLAAVPEELR